MPPVLDIPLPKLARRRGQNLGARRRAQSDCQREDVLQLITETERSSRLVKSGAPPDPAGEGLIEKPAVEHQIHRAVGRRDLQGSEHVFPSATHFRERGGQVRRAIALDQPAPRGLVRRSPEQEKDLDLLSGREADGALQSRGGIQARPRPAGERDSRRERGGRFEISVSAEELSPIARPRRGAASSAHEEIGERRPAKLLVPRIAREESAGAGVAAADDERRGGTALCAEYPFRVEKNRERSSLVRSILDREPRDLDRIFQRHELEQVERDAPTVVLESTVALAVPDHVGPVVPKRKRCGSPDLVARLVAKENRFAGRVAHRVVGPRRQLVLPAVAGPGVTGARLGGEETE